MNLTVSENQPVYAFAPGVNHIPFLKPVIRSIIRNCKGAAPHFCILLPEIQESISIEADCTFKIISDHDLAKCRGMYFKEGRSDIPPFATYSQLMIPRYFSEFQKILFLEVDQIVQGDLAGFWQDAYARDIKLGAVRSIDSLTGKLNTDSPDPLFEASYPGAKYYNMGVFLFDTKYWIDYGFEEKCAKYAQRQLRENGGVYRYYAQGAMNCALHDVITDLDPIYNWTGLGYKEMIPSHLLQHAIILHWNGSKKPWENEGLYKDYYLNAAGISAKDLAELAKLGQSDSSFKKKISKRARLAKFMAKMINT